MNRNLFSIVPLAALTLLAAVPAIPARAELSGLPHYRVARKIVLGGEGGWDYLSVDPDGRRLYISRGSHVMVVNADTYKIVGDIPNTNGVHGIAIASKLGRGFTSNGRANTVTIFDLKTLKTLGTVPVGTGPDCIVYEPKTQRVFTFNGRSNDATAIDAKTGKVLGTIALGGRPEFAAVDDMNGMVYDNLESTSEVVAIDAQSLTLKSRWPLAPAESPSGLAIDVSSHLLFSTCDDGKMAVSSTLSHKRISMAAIGNGPDAAAYNDSRAVAYSSNGQDGTLTVLHEYSIIPAGHLENTYTGGCRPIQTLPTQAGARTMAFDAKTDRVFLVTATPDPKSPGEGRRRNYVPGSFTLLVLADINHW